MALPPLGTSKTTPPTTQCYTPDDVNLQQHRCDNFKSRRTVKLKCKSKEKLILEQTMKAQLGSRGIALFSLTSTLDRGGWSTPRPGCFTPGKAAQYPLYRRLREPHGRSGQTGKIWPPPEFDPRTVQLIKSRLNYVYLLKFVFCSGVAFVHSTVYRTHERIFVPSRIYFLNVHMLSAMEYFFCKPWTHNMNSSVFLFEIVSFNYLWEHRKSTLQN
jgi:hypothetical protein